MIVLTQFIEIQWRNKSMKIYLQSHDLIMDNFGIWFIIIYKK